MNFTITNDPVEQYQGRGNSGRYDSVFSKLTPESNCLVFDDFYEMERVAQALDRYVKQAKITGAKVRTTKSYKQDGKPRCWLVFADVPRTTIRGNFPKEIK